MNFIRSSRFLFSVVVPFLALLSSLTCLILLYQDDETGEKVVRPSGDIQFGEESDTGIKASFSGVTGDSETMIVSNPAN